jgi:hypothetical protein
MGIDARQAAAIRLPQSVEYCYMNDWIPTGMVIRFVRKGRDEDASFLPVPVQYERELAKRKSDVGRGYQRLAPNFQNLDARR